MKRTGSTYQVLARVQPCWFHMHHMLPWQQMLQLMSDSSEANEIQTEMLKRPF